MPEHLIPSLCSLRSWNRSEPFLSPNSVWILKNIHLPPLLEELVTSAKHILRKLKLSVSEICEVVAWRLESWACNLKVAGSILAPAGTEGGDCEWTALSLHLQYHDWGSLEQGTEPPIAPRALEQWLPTAVCVHLDGLNAEHQFRVWVTILDNTSHYYY